MNQGLADSVEAVFHERSVMATILRILNTSGTEDPRFLWKIDAGSREERLVYFHNDRVVDAAPPEYGRIQRIAFPMLRRDGSEVLCELALPFEVVNKVVGSEVVVAQRTVEKHAKQTHTRVQEYLEKLFAHPESDPQFAKFIEENDIGAMDLLFNVRLTYEPGLSPDETRILERAHLVDGAVVARYFAKIALLFAAQSKNLSLLTTASTAALRTYLRELFVDPQIACAPDGSVFSVFSSAVIAGRTEYWWGQSYDSATVTINTDRSLTSSQRELLHIHNELRHIHFLSIRPLISVRRLGELPADDVGPTLRARAYHDLVIGRQQHALSAEGVYCDIRLFGGLFDVSVTLSADASVPFAPADKHIETRWFEAAL